VRAHIFLCLLAYYVEWHIREAWRALMFADIDSRTKTASRTSPNRTRSNSAHSS